MILKKLSLKFFINDKSAVMGLPLRLTVCLVIGSAALMFILLYILNPCLIPEKIVLNVDPMINIIPSGVNEDTFSITVQVMDKDGFKINNANVIIKGLGDAASNNTNNQGLSTISITPHLDPGQNEGYLDIIVKAQCKETFSQNKMIKVVRDA